MQTYSSVGIRPRSAVFQIALDDAAYPRKLAADLVMPSRKQLNLKQGVSLRVPQMGVDQLCQFGSRSLFAPLAMKLLFIFSLRTSQSSNSADSFSGALQHSAQ